jgi:hypothetical protein
MSNDWPINCRGWQNSYAAVEVTRAGSAFADQQPVTAHEYTSEGEDGGYKS